MKLAILNDTHCGVRNSSETFLDYQEKFYRDVFFPYLVKHDIKKIIHLGDYYDHRKMVNFRPLSHNREVFLEPLRDFGMTMDIIPGNHDAFYKNTLDILSPRELFGEFSDCVNLIIDPEERQYESLKVAFLPWINQENYKGSMRFVEKTKAPVLFAHLELVGFEMHRGQVAFEGMNPADFSRFDMVISGHYHTKSTSGNIHYLGSQMEFTWSDVDDPKAFHILDTETRELTAVPNPHILFKRFNYDDEKEDYKKFDMSVFDDKFVKILVINKSNQARFDNFIAQVNERPVHDLKISETYVEFSGDRVNIDEEEVSVDDTYQLLDGYVDGVDTELDKEKLKTQMRDLLSEAQVFDAV